MLMEGGACSKPLYPSGSMVTGAVSSPFLARAATYRPLAQIQGSFGEVVGLRAWIDDLTQRMESTVRRVVAGLITARGQLGRAIEDQGWLRPR